MVTFTKVLFSEMGVGVLRFFFRILNPKLGNFQVFYHVYLILFFPPFLKPFFSILHNIYPCETPELNTDS